MQVIPTLPPKTRKMLDALAEQSNKTAGILEPATFERFCHFAIVSHVEGVNLDPEDVHDYLKLNQWPAEQADTAAKRYKAARFLLSLYDQYKSEHLAI